MYIEVTPNSEEITPECRYCLSNNNPEDLFTPCKCSGSSGHVHKECLKQWIMSKQKRVVIPGYLSQYNVSCEICNTPYKCKIIRVDRGKKELYLDMFKYIVLITVSLFSLYACVGALFLHCNFIPFYKFDSDIETALFNSFVFIHIILGVFYVLLALCYPHGGFTCFFFDCGSGGSGDGNGGILLLGAVFIVGVVMTIIIIYVDILNRVIQRHKNLSMEILDFELPSIESDP